MSAFDAVLLLYILPRGRVVACDVWRVATHEYSYGSRVAVAIIAVLHADTSCGLRCTEDVSRKELQQVGM